MNYEDFRRKLNIGEIDPNQKQDILREREYFASVAPRPFLHGIREKLRSGKHPLAVLLLAFLGVLLLFIALVYVKIFFVAFLLLLFYLNVLKPKLAKREYKEYDYLERIAEPTLHLFDDKLTLGYHDDSTDLVDEKMPYQNALAEARLVKPFGKRCEQSIYGWCSYDWENASDLDAFEYVRTYLYYVTRDSETDREDVTSYFNGHVMKFRTSFAVNGSIHVMSTTSKRSLLGGEKKKNPFKKIKDRELALIESGNREFDENFDVAATFEDEAYRYLTPAVMESLLELRKDCFFSLCFKGNVITVAIDNETFRSLGNNNFYFAKPAVDPQKASEEFDEKIDAVRFGLMTICEVKEAVDPGSRYVG